MKRKILITGASGFAGGHLAKYLLSLGTYDIYGTYRSESSLAASPVKNLIKFIRADLQKKEEIMKLLSDVKPDGIFHLAAQAAIGLSIQDPLGTMHDNIDGELLLFEALRELQMANVRTVAVLSADVYGYVLPGELPIKETTPFRPGNPYAVSKITCDYLAYQYWRSYKMPIIRARPFTHIGSGQKTGFVASDFARQIARIEKGQQDAVIKVGNLDAKRDFTDVRDIVRAYENLLDKGKPGGVYNIGSGISHKVSEILEYFLSHAKLPIAKEVDPDKIRPSDIPDFRADYSRLNSLTGWEPKIPFETSLQDVLDYWRSIV